MPDASYDSDDRTAFILESVKRAFAEKGFDGASMQDLARAAGMSAGNFYRYFPSKDAIVSAMIMRDLAEVKADFACLLASPDPAEALFAAFEIRLENKNSCDGPLWAEIDAAARRKPDIARLVRAMEDEVCALLTAAMAHITGRDPTEAQTLYAGQAAFLVLMFKAASHRLHEYDCPTGAQTNSQVRKFVLATIKRAISDLVPAATRDELR